MSVELSTLLYAAFRIAGITDRPGRTPSTDQIGDAIPTLNRLLGSWDIDRSKIFTIEIDAYDLVPGQKTYQIGPGGADFPAALRPTEIENANIIVNTTSPVVREPVHLLTSREWAAIQLQDISGTIPWALYNDYAMAGSGYSTLYLYGQALATYQLELFTWQQLQKFVSPSDSVLFPNGYEHAIVWNLALLIAASFPTQAKIMPEARVVAWDALNAIQGKNATAPTMKVDPAIVNAGGGRRGGDYKADLGNDW